MKQQSEIYDERGIPISQYYENRIFRLKNKYPTEQIEKIFFGHIIDKEESSVFIRFSEDKMNASEEDNAYTEQYEAEFPLSLLKLSLNEKEIEQLQDGSYVWFYTFKNSKHVEFEHYKAIWTEKMIKQANEEAEKLFNILHKNN